MRKEILATHIFIKKSLTICALALGLAVSASAQFPKLPKFEKPQIPGSEQKAPVMATSNSNSNASAASNAPLSTSAHLLKRTIEVQPRRFQCWWKNPNVAEPDYDTWSWAPEIKFAINGPVASGSQITVEFDDANGKLWFTQKMRTPELDADRWEMVEHAENMNFDQLEKKAITTPNGLFAFRIKLKNELNGTDVTLFSGKYKLSTYLTDPKFESTRGKKEFYVDEDWRLPMAWLWLNPEKNETAPILCAQVWFRGSDASEHIEAYLFYNGKQISNYRSGVPEQTLTNAADEKPYRYSLRMFYFSNVKGFNKDPYPERYKDSFQLDRNPGEYEIKILRGGELARSLKFTVGSDGKIVDNGVVRQNQIGGIRMLMPIKIIGALDGKFNPSAWTSDAFYGNTLGGFTAAQ